MVGMLALLGVVLALGALFWRLRRDVPVSVAKDVDRLESGPDPDYDVEIGDELDLHGVAPGEVVELVDAFIELAVRRRRAMVKIVHGKGTGRLRARVRERLSQLPHVVRFEDAASPGSGWGATIVHVATPPEVASGEPSV